jgi:hypothetical protein
MSEQLEVLACDAAVITEGIVQGALLALLLRLQVD